MSGASTHGVPGHRPRCPSYHPEERSRTFACHRETTVGWRSFPAVPKEGLFHPPCAPTATDTREWARLGRRNTKQRAAGVGGEDDRVIGSPSRPPGSLDFAEREGCPSTERHFPHFARRDVPDPLSVRRIEGGIRRRVSGR